MSWTTQNFLYLCVPLMPSRKDSCWISFVQSNGTSGTRCGKDWRKSHPTLSISIHRNLGMQWIWFGSKLQERYLQQGSICTERTDTRDLSFVLTEIPWFCVVRIYGSWSQLSSHASGRDKPCLICLLVASSHSLHWFLFAELLILLMEKKRFFILMSKHTSLFVLLAHES